MQKCDICKTKNAFYDAKIPGTLTWANFCKTCFKAYGCSLGLGYGQPLKGTNESNK